MKISVLELKTGDIVERFPYGGAEKLPVVVKWVHHARAKNSRIVEGTDADGRSVLVPVGHYTNLIEVKR